jgi:hypothetical protein
MVYLGGKMLPQNWRWFACDKCGFRVARTENASILEGYCIHAAKGYVVGYAHFLRRTSSPFHHI